MFGEYELVPVTVAATLTCGSVLAVVANLCVPLAKRIGVSEGRTYFFSTILSVSFIPMTLLSGLVVDQVGVEWVLIGGSLVTAVAVAGLAVTKRMWPALFLIALVAMASGGVLVAGNVLMPAAFFPEAFGHRGGADPRPAVSALEARRLAAAAFNLGNIFFVLGTLAAAPLVNIAINRIGFRKALGLTALLCLLPALMAALTDVQAFPTFQRADAERLFAGPAIWLTALVFLFYGPLENIGANWSSSWLKDLGFHSRGRAWVQSGFWIAFLASRLLAAFLLERDLVRPTWVWLALVPALAAAVLMGNLAGVGGRATAPWGFMLFGFLLGPVLPTMLGTIYQRFSRDAGTAIGAMYAAGAVGSLILVPAMGLYARRTSVQRALVIPAVLALLLGAVVLALHIA